MLAEAPRCRFTRGSEGLSGAQNHPKLAPRRFEEGWSIYHPCPMGAPLFSLDAMTSLILSFCLLRKLLLDLSTSAFLLAYPMSFFQSRGSANEFANGILMGLYRQSFTAGAICIICCLT